MTAIRDILVHVEDTDAAGERLRAAAALASRHDAALHGAFVRALDTLVLPMAPDPAAAAASLPVVTEERQREEERAHARFERIAAAGGVAATTWQGIEDLPDHAVARAARLVDLAVLGQPDHD